MGSMNDFSLDRDHPVDLSEQIGRKLVSAIEAGTLMPGDRLPGERDLARLFRVSKDTLRKGIAIAVERGLVAKSPSRGNYVTSPEILAGTRVRRRVFTFLHMDEFCPWEELVRGLSRELHALGLELVMNDTFGWSREEFLRMVTSAIQEQAAGLIIYPYHLNTLGGFYRDLAKEDTPVVLIDAGMNMGLDTVVVDDDAAISLAVRHLYAQGHRHIGYADVNPGEGGVAEHTTRRLEAYRKACGELGLQEDHMRCEPVADEASLVPSPGVRAQFRKRLKKTFPTGMVCFNDTVAAALWAAAEDAGVRVPEELSIVGYDNDRAVESWAHPLTTIDPMLMEMGTLAARRLAQLMDGNNECGRLTMVHPKLLVRGSTTEPGKSNRTANGRE